jgi:DNA-binding CsgD family transcriptional regulator
VVEEGWKKKVAFLDGVSVQNNVVVFLFNTYTNGFLYMSDKLKTLSGLDPELFTGMDGFAQFLSRRHPAQIEASVKLQQLSIESFIEHQPCDYQSAVMCLSYLFKNGGEEYVQILQRSVALEVDEIGRPALLLNFIHYVGHIKKHDSLGCVISIPGKILMYDYDHELNEIGPAKTFSQQEKIIIGLLAQGFDTKSIARKLFISPHTVETHRRNLIKKTNCTDTTGVVTFAKLINLI